MCRAITDAVALSSGCWSRYRPTPRRIGFIIRESARVNHAQNAEWEEEEEMRRPMRGGRFAAKNNLPPTPDVAWTFTAYFFTRVLSKFAVTADE